MDSRLETATLAGGCFWGMQDLIRKQTGVIETRVGYIGGHTKNPTYADVKKGNTGHAEAIEVVFDPTKTNFATILRFFFRMHDPTTLNRQGQDLGSQYRSAIFYHDDSQRLVAEKIKKEVHDSGKWPNPVVTEITKATEFTAAEAEHQDYLERIPDGYTCHFVRD